MNWISKSAFEKAVSGMSECPVHSRSLSFLSLKYNGINEKSFKEYKSASNQRDNFFVPFFQVGKNGKYKYYLPFEKKITPAKKSDYSHSSAYSPLRGEREGVREWLEWEDSSSRAKNYNVKFKANYVDALSDHLGIKSNVDAKIPWFQLIIYLQARAGKLECKPEVKELSKYWKKKLGINSREFSKLFSNSEWAGSDVFSDVELSEESIVEYLLDFGETGEDPADVRLGELNSDSVNLIVYGAPGTGKSHYLNGLTEPENTIRTVFHSDYLNSDFVGSYKPYKSGSSITYEFVPGPFILAFVRAIKNPDEYFLLLIEELNRADAPSVFGEVFQLLDRDGTGKSVYSVDPEKSLSDYLTEELGDQWPDNKLYLPSNLALAATMNSSDQGVQPLDSAFKRRWRFIHMPIDFDKLPRHVANIKANIFEGVNCTWREFAEAVNALFLSVEINEDRLLGPFFLSVDEISNEEEIKKSISGKVLIYIWDDVLRHGNRHLIFSEEFRDFTSIMKSFNAGINVFSKALSKRLSLPTESEPNEEDVDE